MSQETKYFKDAVNGMHYYKVNGSSTNVLHVHANRTNESHTFEQVVDDTHIIYTTEAGAFCVNNIHIKDLELEEFLPCKNEEFREVMAWVDYQIANM